MPNSIPRPDRPPRNRLEGWLSRKVQGGALKSLPRYVPVRGLAGHCPEDYARGLLVALRRPDVDPLTTERLRDDGRAFRSWAERALFAIPRDGNRYHGVAV